MAEQEDPIRTVEPDVHHSSVARRLARGIAVTATGRTVAQLISWFSTLLLVRLLTPDDYGVAGLALAASAIASNIAGFGIGSTVRGIASLSGDDVERLFFAAIISGAVGGALLAAAAPLISVQLAEPRTVELIRYCGLTLFFESVRSVPYERLARQGRYTEIVRVDLVRGLVSTASVLTFALMGFGYRALVFGMLCGSAAATVAVLWRRAGVPTVQFTLPRKSLVTSSLLLLTTSLAWQLFWNADTFVVGRVLGTASVGVFGMAKLLATMPNDRLGSLVTTLSQASFAEVSQEDGGRLNLLVLLIETIGWLVVLPLALLFVASTFVVTVGLGSAWMPSTVVLKYLIPSMALWAFLQPVSQAAVSSGKVLGTTVAYCAVVPIAAAAYYFSAQLGGLTGAALSMLVPVSIVAILHAKMACAALSCSPRTLMAAASRPAGTALVVVSIGSAIEIALQSRFSAQVASFVGASLAALLGLALFWKCDSLVANRVRGILTSKFASMRVRQPAV